MASTSACWCCCRWRRSWRHAAAPLTASVVVMEMTGSQPMLFWLLVGALLASGVSRQFCPQPFYHLAAGRFRRQALVEAGRAAKPVASPVSGS